MSAPEPSIWALALAYVLVGAGCLVLFLALLFVIFVVTVAAVALLVRCAPAVLYRFTAALCGVESEACGRLLEFEHERLLARIDQRTAALATRRVPAHSVV